MRRKDQDAPWIQPHGYKRKVSVAGLQRKAVRIREDIAQLCLTARAREPVTATYTARAVFTQWAAASATLAY